MRLAAMLLLAAPAVAGTDPGARKDPAFGLWYVEDGSAVVEIAPCGDGACGRIVGLSDPDGPALRDARNPDAALRQRPICGLPLLGGFRADGPGAWGGGHIYNAREGRTYRAAMVVDDADRLRLRGYVGIPALGQTQTWTRAQDADGC